MTQRKDQLAERLVAAIRELPEAQVAEVLDFVGFLQAKYGRRPEVGSAGAILQAFQEHGPLQFAPGELDALLADIELMRDRDLEEHL